MNLLAIRAAGIAGILGAICWTIGDILLVGGSASPEQYPLLLRDYADRIPFKALAWMLPFDEPRLAAGAMIANLSIPLYLAGSWHLYQGVKPAGGALPFAAFALLFCANAWSPLGHASFYYPAMVYKAIPTLPDAAHPSLLTLGAQFSRMQAMAWFLAVIPLALGMMLLCATILARPTRYPRWSAVVLNPVAPLLLAATGAALPPPVGLWFFAAVLNVGFFIVYALSTILLWNGGRTFAR
ncbi:DUF6796 family protein [Sphingomonas sp. 2378]|uniref:DUF6796 family protein n=1 Tax=Sphingomonas sp. 2378 TaxID=1219748 RepID=UPI00311AE6F1